ncbi:choice-of-anchor A family protein [Paenibacillus sp. FSL R10-2734]|uniref:choice-of-anchor A family protein n=1 Tax=Paenibacillus sp. FSL R10-2734 TaxID=2954691 RepID=UPI0030D83FD4
MKRRIKPLLAMVLAGILAVGSGLSGGYLVNAADEVLPYTPTPVLGIAGNFNAFIFGDFAQKNDQIQGRLAAGGNITLENYGVARAYSSGDVLIAGKDLNYINSGQVHGTAVYGEKLSANSQGINFMGGTRKDKPIDFAAEEQFLISRSEEYGALSATGKYSKKDQQIIINAPDAFNVIDLDGPTLAVASLMQFNIANNATLIINVSGSSIHVPSFAMQNGKANKVIFNFYEATSLNIEYTSFFGTILAPKAIVSYAGAELYGTLIAKSFSGGVEMHLGMYEGEEPPPTPTPTTSPTPTPSVTPTPTTSPTPTPSVTPTPTPSVSPTPTTSPTPTPSVSPTPTTSPTPTPSVSPTPTTSPTPTPSIGCEDTLFANMNYIMY